MPAPSSPAQKLKRNITLFLLAALALNLVFWMGSKDVFIKWRGVPPLPSKTGVLMMTLGDIEFSYRLGALTLQQLGDSGGQTTALKDYDYAALAKWFWLLNELDPASDHVPLLAAYYFGAVEDPEKISHVVNYLGTIGQNPYGSKWRWLVQAILQARHKMKDLDLALELSYKLSKMEPIGDVLPHWARQMPAFVLAAKGDKEDSRRVIEEMLLTSEHFHPNEVRFMKDYLTRELGVPAQEVEELMKRRTLPISEDLGVPKPSQQAR